jgi:hypothetical protein
LVHAVILGNEASAGPVADSTTGVAHVLHQPQNNYPDSHADHLSSRQQERGTKFPLSLFYGSIFYQNNK